jgi:hypothetical protein
MSWKPMLKIDRSTEDGAVRLALSGRIEGAGLAELERTIACETAMRAAITVDLKEVRLLDREAVRFLVKCETAGIRLVGAPAYVREWVAREQNGLTAGPPDNSSNGDS